MIEKLQTETHRNIIRRSKGHDNGQTDLYSNKNKENTNQTFFLKN